ncbi:hypothetical protein K474DRAFT_1657316 [Panus rudis PR-1116 ss-1]|nr:hypothetical protein K474DRAFT_1657316 [Panus rudis PR-1116 ss-1]
MDIAISRGETVYIPQEIVDYIIDCVPRDAKRILSTCAAITRSWVPRARLHLFREVHINPHYCTGTHPGFCRFLEENPDVAAFIHTLTLRGLTYEIEDESIVAMTPYYMSIIASRLRNLESLMISNMTWNTTVRTGLSGKPLQNWPPTNPLKLDTLHISSCLVSKGTSAGLLEMLEGFSYVRDLHFEQIQLREKRIAPSKTSLPQPIKALETEHLTLDCEASTGQRKFNEAILSTRCGKTVRHLTLVLHGLKEASVAKAALRIVKNKLQHFDLDIVDYEGLNDQSTSQALGTLNGSLTRLGIFSPGAVDDGSALFLLSIHHDIHHTHSSQ